MTRRAQGILVALAVVTAVALTAGGAALAGSGAHYKVIKGGAGANKLVGTNGPDKIAGHGGADTIRGRGGRDVLEGGRGGDSIGGGKGFDRIVGGPGGDTIDARDGRPDTIDCGDGNDFAKVDRDEDGVFDCETVRGPKGPKVAQAAARVPRVRHVFIVVLENENASSTFGPHTEAPYLAKTLKRKGAFVPNYYGIAHNSEPNYIAMISGQSPNIQSQADCPLFNDVTPGTPMSDGQAFGTGCVYPPGVHTIANQLGQSGYSWKGYMEDMNANAPKGGQSPCRHPDIGERDPWQHATPTDEYATRHNPFVYFHSIIDRRICRNNVVDYTHLKHDLRNRRTAPDYSLIVPGLCHDGHDAPCANGAPGGLVSANRWLRREMPALLHSSAFQHRGLLIVTFDEAEATGSDADSTACCNEKPGPSIVPPDTPGGLHPGPGGGRIGAVMVSPCIKPGTVTHERYNHYSLLRSMEANFRLPYLGYAGQAGLRPFGNDIFTRPGC